MGIRPLFFGTLAILAAGMLRSSADAFPLPQTARDTARVKERRSERRESPRPVRPAGTDTTWHVDTSHVFRIPTLIGSYDPDLDSGRYFSPDELRWLDTRSLGETLQKFPGAFLMDQSSIGQYDGISFRGGDWRGVAFAADGRPLNDPASGIFNPSYFSPEYAERVEIITGPRAFLYGLNSASGAVNLVTKNFNTNTPFTKIVYSEGAYNYLLSDGTFSQNISRRLNVAAGFQHQGTDGKYVNSAYEEWNVRAKLRYALSDDLTLLLSEYMTSTSTDMNGGINFALDGAIFTVPTSQHVVNSDSYEKITRHDLDLTLVGTPLGDSADVSMLTLYYSHNLREYRDDENRPSPNGILIHSDHTSSWMGALFTQVIKTGIQRFNMGSTVELRQIEGSPNLGRRRNVIGNVWAKEEFLLGDLFTLSAYGRYDRYLHADYFGVGTDATWKLGGRLTLFGGISVSHRLPTYEELYWTDSTVSRPDGIVAERHAQIEAGVELGLPANGTVRFAYFHRDIQKPILLLPYDTTSVFPGVAFVNGGRIATDGVEARVGLHIWMLYLEGTATAMTQRSNGATLEIYPKLFAEGGLYFWHPLVEGHLDLKAGFQGRYASSWRGDRFNPEILAYVENSGVKMGFASSVDFILVAHLGDAYIHLAWENLTNVAYFTAPYFPGRDRSIRFGVAWNFFN